MKMRVDIPVILLTIFLGSFVSGCSLIGFGFGAAADAEQPGIRIHLPAGLDSLPSGTDVQIVTKDHRSLNASYISAGLGPDNGYAERFQRWRDSVRVKWSWVPELGSQITILAHSDQKHLLIQGQFAGFDSGSVLLQSQPGSSAFGTSPECIDTVRDSTRNTLADRELIHRTLASGVPFESDARIPSIFLGGPIRSLPLADIDSLMIPVSGNQKWIGLGVGAVVDLAVAILVVNTIGGPLAERFKPKFAVPFNVH